MVNKNLILEKKGFTKYRILTAYRNKEPIVGEFAGIFKENKNYIIYRDHLGCKKFFFVFKKGQIYTSNNFLELMKHGKDSIRSAQPGYYLKINKNGKLLSKIKIPQYRISNDRLKSLKIYLNSVKKNYGSKCIVCLSGGLDSTIIAYLAKKIFKNVKLITIHFNNNKHFNLSSDYMSSKKIGNYLNLSHIFIKVDKKEILKNLKNIMKACQDWRDYNVHCACLNYLIARYIKKDKRLKKRVILTGDFMNEFVADYTSENFFGKDFYKVPNISKKTLQRFFTGGLDTSSRESGVFDFLGLTIFQPYNCLKDYYFQLSQRDLNEKNFKYRINKKLIPKKLYSLVNKKKIRAQIGDQKNGGILKIFHEKKIYQNELEKKFSNYFNCTIKWMRSFIQLGRFKN